MAVATQVDASTIKAGQLFSTSRFHIPDFQRDYSWEVDAEVADFWADLAKALDSPPYFLGLLIMTEEDEHKTVVDGQQRILTLTMLANAVFRAAHARKKQLVAETMRDVFLYAVDYEANDRVPRVDPAARRDHASLEALLTATEGDLPSQLRNKNLLEAQRYLDKQLEAYIGQGDESARLAKWAHFLTNGITFAVFEHPNRSAAYKVFEVVNARGKDLTPAQLIKSYVIGSVGRQQQPGVYARWTALEDSFVELGAHAQFTQFIRNVITLKYGYVEARDLYDAIVHNYPEGKGASDLLDELEREWPTYLLMVNPQADEQDEFLRSLVILDALGLRTVRPIFLALAHGSADGADIRRLMRIIVPRMVIGTFGTGSVERRFADAARRIASKAESRRRVIESLEDLRPSATEFADRVGVRSLPKGLQHVVRAAVLQKTPVPQLEGFVHQVRPRNAEAWPGFSDAQFAALGQTVGNYFISESERRPRGTNTFAGAIERLLPTAIPLEDPELHTAKTWSAMDVESKNERIARSATMVWYG